MAGTPARVAWPTLGGKQLWADLWVHCGYRIQENVVTRRCRLLGPRNGRLAGGSFDDCREAFERVRALRDPKPCSDHLVLLLHGMFRGRGAFGPMERHLREAGYEAAAIEYPSTRRDLEAHAAQVARVLEGAEGAERVSFVTHSLGGLVARMVLGRGAPWMDRLQVHRLVFIGTPNQGAELADRLAPLPLFHAVAGPCGAQLTTAHAPEIPLPTCPFGIVAGIRGDGNGWNPFIDGEDDMTVSAASATLDGAEDVLLVRATHTFVMRRPEVLDAVERYLGTGRFTAEEERPAEEGPAEEPLARGA